MQDNDFVSDIVSKNELDRLKRKMRSRLFISLSFMLIILGFFANYQSEQIKTNAMQNAVNKVDAKLETVSSLENSYIDFLKNIVFQLSSNTKLQNYIISRDELSKHLILDNWAKVSEQTDWMLQVRFISNSGHELLKIEYDQEKKMASDVQVLQNKSKKDYFQIGKQLKKGDIYISPIELNREFGELSYPITPVFRIVTNVYSPTGQSLGILVVNFIADKLMSVNFDVLSTEPGKTYVLDQQGNYLKGGSEAQNWAQVLSPDANDSFGQGYKATWEKLQNSIQSDNKGVISSEYSQFAYRLLGLTEGLKESVPYIVIHEIKADDLGAALHPQLVKNNLTYLLIFAILSFSLWFYYKRKLHQESEHHSLELISALFYSNEAIFITDKDWKLSVINQAFSRITGYSRDEVIGLNIEELYFLDDPDLFKEILQALETNEHWLGEIRTLSKNATWITNVISINTVKNRRGEVSHYVVQMIDISDRKEMEEKLKIAAAAFETRSAITITDSHGNIIRVNKAFTDITGYQESEVLGKNPNVLSSGKHPQSFYQDLWKSIVEEGSWQGEIYNRHKDGSIFPEWINISSIKGEDGEVKYYVATFEDITERKRLEAEIESLSK